MPYTVTRTDRQLFESSGVILLKNILSPDEVATLRRGIERGYAHPSPRHKIASEDSDKGRFFEDFRCASAIPEYREIIFCSELPRVAAELMGSRTVRLHHDHMLVKEAKTEQRTPWHQDMPYYNIEGNQHISFWMPVDPVPEDSALEFIVGSHKWPWIMPRTFKDHEAKWFPEGSLPEMPDIEGNRREYPIVSFDMQPGDAVAFNLNTLHGGKGSTALRRAMSVRYTGDDVVFAPRKWVTSPPFPELDANPSALAAGSPLIHSLFPVAYACSTVAKL